MGWPIGWSNADADQTSDQKARSARRASEWRALLRMRLAGFFDQAPRGLQQAARSEDHVPKLPRQTPCERALGESPGHEKLRDMRSVVHSQEGSRQELFKELREHDGLDSEERAMSNRADRLRCGGNGVVALCAAVAFVELVRRARNA